MMSVGHGAMGAPTSLTGGAALGNVNTGSQHKLDELSAKIKKKKEETKKSEDQNMPTDEKDPKDWDTLLGEKLNRFSQLIRSEVVRLKIKKLKDKIKS